MNIKLFLSSVTHVVINGWGPTDGSWNHEWQSQTGALLKVNRGDQLVLEPNPNNSDEYMYFCRTSDMKKGYVHTSVVEPKSSV